jgi:hypothetical protein
MSEKGRCRQKKREKERERERENETQKKGKRDKNKISQKEARQIEGTRKERESEKGVEILFRGKLFRV